MITARVAPAAPGLADDASAAAHAVGIGREAQDGHGLSRQQRRSRPVAALDRARPHRDRLHGIARAPDIHVGNQPQAGGLFDRLMCRAVIAETDRVVGQEEHHPAPRRRRYPQRVARVFREHQEGADERSGAVAVGPGRVGRIVPQESVPQRVADLGHSHRHAGMAGTGLLHRIHRQRPRGMAHQLACGRRRNRTLWHTGARIGNTGGAPNGRSRPVTAYQRCGEEERLEPGRRLRPINRRGRSRLPLIPIGFASGRIPLTSPVQIRSGVPEATGCPKSGHLPPPGPIDAAKAVTDPRAAHQRRVPDRGLR